MTCHLPQRTVIATGRPADLLTLRNGRYAIFSEPTDTTAATHFGTCQYYSGITVPVTYGVFAHLMTLSSTDFKDSETEIKGQTAWSKRLYINVPITMGITVMDKVSQLITSTPSVVSYCA